MHKLDEKEYVESVLKTKVVSFEVTNGCKAGDNVAGSLKAITAVEENGSELHVVYKFIPENPPSFIIDEKIFRIEHKMYKTIAPMMEKFARSHGLCGYSPPLPKYISGFNDDRNDYIVLEDVRPSGYVMPDKLISRTCSEMSVILTELAKFHAIAYGLIQYEGQMFFESEELKDIRHVIPTGPLFLDELIHYNYQITVDLMKERHPELAKHMIPLLPDAAKIRCATDCNPNYFQTLIHNDLWTNNLMMKYDDAGNPVDVKLIDFQFFQVGNVFSELLYFIFTSTTPDYRRKYLESNLSLYFDTFSDTLKEMKIPCPVGFTKGFLIDEFMKGYLSAYVHMTFAIPLQLGCFTPPDKTGEDEHYEAPLLVQHYYFANEWTFKRLVDVTKEVIDLKLI